MLAASIRYTHQPGVDVGRRQVYRDKTHIYARAAARQIQPTATVAASPNTRLYLATLSPGVPLPQGTRRDSVVRPARSARLQVLQEGTGNASRYAPFTSRLQLLSTHGHLLPDDNTVGSLHGGLERLVVIMMY